jgi:6-phosphogluconolactonase (cycloisomerase 2 family)
MTVATSPSSIIAAELKKKAARHTIASTLLVIALIAINPQQSQAQSSGAVFVMTNAAETNQVIAYARDSSGKLSTGVAYNTGGLGSGGTLSPLGSQGGLTLCQDHTMLFAVNAGSGTLSVFGVDGAALFLLETIPTNGSEPVAVAQQGNSVYVLDGGGQESVSGFRIEGYGDLQSIAKSTTYLTPFAGGSAPSSIAISPNGQSLMVIERGINQLDFFPINMDGTLGTEVTSPSAGLSPFAGVFAPGGFAVVAQVGASLGAVSSVTAYSLANGTFSGIAGDTNILTGGAAACWNVFTPNGQFMYVSNAASSTIAEFSFNSSTGQLLILPGSPVSNAGATLNLDLAVSSDGKFLYSINSGSGTISAFAIQSDGTLGAPTQTTVPNAANTGVQGIAAY